MKFPKTFGGFVSLGMKALGASIVFIPTIEAVQDTMKNAPGNWGYLPGRVLYYYTGVDSNNNYQVNTSVLLGGVASVAGGILLAKLGTVVGKMLR